VKWKKAQKKDRKNKISETIKRIIPNFKPEIIFSYEVLGYWLQRRHFFIRKIWLKLKKYRLTLSRF